MQNYNLIIDVRDTEYDSPSTSEPVSLAEVKNFLRLESWEDELSSTADITFSTDDSLINEMITAARVSIEQITGLSLIPHEYRVVLTNLAGMIELPFGPIGDAAHVFYQYDVNYEFDDVANIILVGTEFKRVRFPVDERITIDYSAGYGRGDTPPIPKALKQAILRQVAYWYENRGDETADEGLSKHVRVMIAPYKRVPWLG